MAELYIGNNQIGGGSSADLSNYYNKSEIDSSVNDLKSGFFLEKLYDDSGTNFVWVPNTLTDSEKTEIKKRIPQSNQNNQIVFSDPYISNSAIPSTVGTNTYNNSTLSLGKSVASGEYAIAIGYGCLAQGQHSFAQGRTNKAQGNYSHAEGTSTTASGNYSHAEGYYTTASGTYCHAEGYYTTASGYNGASHAEGYYTTASANYSHAEGDHTTASGNYSHAEGYYTKASAAYSHAEGYYTIASAAYSHAEGLYNNDISTGVILTIGNGDSSTLRHNALEVYLSGDIKISDTYGVGLPSQKSMISLQEKLNTIDTSVNILNAFLNPVLSNVNFVVMNEIDYELIIPDPSTIYFLT